MCKALSVDAHRVMDIFCQDQKLNLSPYYLKPGFAFGGSCLPKDLRALLYKAKTLDVTLPILSSVLPSNQLQIERGVQAVVEKGHKAIGILGISFKAGTDDLRESPMVELTERLLGKGYDVRVYDRNVSLASIHGANRDYILHKIPHLARLMVPSINDVLSHAKTIVIGNAAPEFAEVPRKIGAGQTVIDFVRVSPSRSVAGVYEGLCCAARAAAPADGAAGAGQRLRLPGEAFHAAHHLHGNRRRRLQLRSARRATSSASTRSTFPVSFSRTCSCRATSGSSSATACASRCRSPRSMSPGAGTSWTASIPTTRASTSQRCGAASPMAASTCAAPLPPLDYEPRLSKRVRARGVLPRRGAHSVGRGPALTGKLLRISALR